MLLARIRSGETRTLFLRTGSDCGPMTCVGTDQVFGFRHPWCRSCLSSSFVEDSDGLVMMLDDEIPADEDKKQAGATTRVRTRWPTAVTMSHTDALAEVKIKRI